MTEQELRHKIGDALKTIRPSEDQQVFDAKQAIMAAIEAFAASEVQNASKMGGKWGMPESDGLLFDLQQQIAAKDAEIAMLRDIEEYGKKAAFDLYAVYAESEVRKIRAESEINRLREGIERIFERQQRMDGFELPAYAKMSLDIGELCRVLLSDSPADGGGKEADMLNIENAKLSPLQYIVTAYDEDGKEVDHRGVEAWTRKEAYLTVYRHLKPHATFDTKAVGWAAPAPKVDETHKDWVAHQKIVGQFVIDSRRGKNIGGNLYYDYKSVCYLLKEWASQPREGGK